MAEEQEPTRQYHIPERTDPRKQEWDFRLYPKKAGPPLRFLFATKRECYEMWDTLSPSTQAKYESWEIARKEV